MCIAVPHHLWSILSLAMRDAKFYTTAQTATTRSAVTGRVEHYLRQNWPAFTAHTALQSHFLIAAYQLEQLMKAVRIDFLLHKCNSNNGFAGTVTAVSIFGKTTCRLIRCISTKSLYIFRFSERLFVRQKPTTQPDDTALLLTTI